MATNPTLRAKWEAIGLSTGPLDVARCWTAINNLYDEASDRAVAKGEAPIPRPRRYYQCGSPLAGAMLITLLTDLETRGATDPTVNQEEFPQDRIYGYEELEILVTERGLRRQVHIHVSTCDFGVHDAGWLEKAEAESAGGVMSKLVANLCELAYAGAGWWWPCQHTVVLTARPASLTVRTNPDGYPELHCEDGPAFAYPDGYGTKLTGGVSGYFLNQIMVPPHVVLAPDAITVKDIQTERNQEVRRIMIDRMTAAKFITALGVAPIDSDTTLNALGLPEELYVIPQGDDSAIAMLRVINGSPEPFGTEPTGDYVTHGGRWFKRYWLGAHPDTKTVVEGVARSYGLTAAEYKAELVART